jgi:small-conductance mechanosensitive channel
MDNPNKRNDENKDYENDKSTNTPMIILTTVLTLVLIIGIFTGGYYLATGMNEKDTDTDTVTAVYDERPSQEIQTGTFIGGYGDESDIEAKREIQDLDENMREQSQNLKESMKEQSQNLNENIREQSQKMNEMQQELSLTRQTLESQMDQIQQKIDKNNRVNQQEDPKNYLIGFYTKDLTDPNLVEINWQDEKTMVIQIPDQNNAMQTFKTIKLDSSIERNNIDKRFEQDHIIWIIPKKNPSTPVTSR